VRTSIKQDNGLPGVSNRNHGLLLALDQAHSQLETRFLNGGAVLMSVMEVLKRLIGSLDLLSSALDEKTTEGTTASILETVGHLSHLPVKEDARRMSLDRLADVCLSMREHVSDMQETMRYLRTFAVTVKITGAGLPGFSAFAEEILERIQSGTQEVSRFAMQLEAMYAQLTEAKDFSAETAQEYAHTVPAIVEDLSRNAANVSDHQKSMAGMAKQVGNLARGVQMKIAAVLSALQIGDITRQRIEHVRTSLDILDAYLLERGADTQKDEWAVRLETAVLHLAAAQMAETAADFRHQCREIVTKITSFVDDTREILTMRDAMASENTGGGHTFLHTLEESVSSAGDVVARVREVSSRANAVAQTTSGTVQDLMHGIEVVRAIKTDIHYMALNSNLRCSKLGEAGRSINVVTSELRIFAGKLEIAAESIVGRLHELTGAAGELHGENSGDEDVGEPLARALVTIRSVCANTEGAIGELANEGQAVFSQVSAAIAKLDFDSELGEIIENVSAGFAEISDTPLDLSGLDQEAEEVGARIFRTYTMMQERAVHETILPGNLPVAPAAPATPASDDDLFEDALF